MLRLYIVRHGETEWNVEKRLQGRKDSNLTPLGITHANVLGERLRQLAFDGVYSSPSMRTMQTARLICGKDATIIPEPRLMEIDLGDWEGRCHGELQQLYPDQYRAFRELPHLYQPVKGESFADVRQRVIPLLEDIISRYKEGNVLTVTHAVVIKTILGYYKGLPLQRLWEPPFIRDTCLSMIEVSNGVGKLVFEADISHLQLSVG